MNSQNAQAERILAEARKICDSRGSGVTITLVGTMGEQFVLIFNIASLADRDPASRDREIMETGKRLQEIEGVARVCYEVLPDRKRSH